MSDTKEVLHLIEQAIELLAAEVNSPEKRLIFDQLTDVWNQLEHISLSPEEREEKSRRIDWNKAKVNTRGIPY